jgi:DNA-binding NarL/FixJ family response regulator
MSGIEATRRIARGSPDVAILVLTMQPTTIRCLPHSGWPFPELTEREREILAMVAAGLNNTAIADRLMLAPKTVRNHISNILTKLHVSDRAQAIIRARSAGLG